MRQVLFKDKDFGVLEFELVLGVPWIHSEVYYWTHNALKEYKEIWKLCKEELKAMGHVKVYVGIPDNDPKLLRFEKMFGFTEVGREGSAIILEQEL